MGSLTGALSGALGGALAGAAIGSFFFPGVGAFVGGVSGAFLGGGSAFKGEDVETANERNSDRARQAASLRDQMMAAITGAGDIDSALQTQIVVFPSVRPTGFLRPAEDFLRPGVLRPPRRDPRGLFFPSDAGAGTASVGPPGSDAATAGSSPAGEP